MPTIDGNGLTIAYELSGPSGGEPLLLIHGVGAQLVRWPDALLDALAARGFRTVRFDNRDVGLSTHFRDAPPPDLAAVIDAKRRGETPVLPYTLGDLAGDAIGLLDALGIASAHVVGVSLGGMIAQQMAIAARARVRSAAIVMSQSGHPDLPQPEPAVLAALAAPAPDPAADREAFLTHSVALNRTLGSPLYPTDEATLRRLAGLAADRAYDPGGGARQIAAGRGAPDRTAALAALDLPVVVIHGVDDPLMPVATGRQLARTIPAAWLLEIAGMGHDLPDPLCDLFADMIAANARRASGR